MLNILGPAAFAAIVLIGGFLAYVRIRYGEEMAVEQAEGERLGREFQTRYRNCKVTRPRFVPHLVKPD